jgi:hypothetical protein
MPRKKANPSTALQALTNVGRSGLTYPSISRDARPSTAVVTAELVEDPADDMEPLGTPADIQDEELIMGGKRGVRKITHTDVVLIMRYIGEGVLTKRQIAERFRVSPKTISRIAAANTDNRDVAKLMFNNKAPEMARNVIEKGRPEDHIDVLRGMEVLAPAKKSNAGSGVVINVGGADVRVGVQVNHEGWD